MNLKRFLSGSTLRQILRPANRSALALACRRAVLPRRGGRVSLHRSLDAVARWLCAAHDVTPDGGVAGCYNLVKGWSTSYPETTGYIIPTFFHYADIMEQPEARHRAIQMADWEVAVQLPSGAVSSGVLGTKAGPAVFNTGQVLFGWVSAYAATGDECYARAAAQACEWLTRAQGDDGAWRKDLSMLTTSSVQTYNVRTAWGLAMVGRELGEKRWVEAALKNCDWALTRQMQNGWFASNAFSDTEDPLLHTIGYVLEGLLGVGELLDRGRYVAAVISGTAPLMDIYRRTGVLAGRYAQQWKRTAAWRCLTGEAQVALVMLRLARITGEQTYTEAAGSLLEGIAGVQDLDSQHPGSNGGVSGSEPIWGGYAPLSYLNWAAKFFMDALLLHVHQVDVQNKPMRHAHKASA